jgi:hypothetical protein
VLLDRWISGLPHLGQYIFDGRRRFRVLNSSPMSRSFPILRLHPDRAVIEALCSPVGIPCVSRTGGLFLDGLLEALSDHFSPFRRMRRSLSTPWQFPAGCCFFRLCRQLSSLVSQTCVFRGVYGFAVVLSRFHHKHISPSAARMWNKFQPFRSAVQLF